MTLKGETKRQKAAVGLRIGYGGERYRPDKGIGKTKPMALSSEMLSVSIRPQGWRQPGPLKWRKDTFYEGQQAYEAEDGRLMEAER